MKKILVFITILIAVGGSSIYAQTVIDKAKQTPIDVLPITDVAKTTNDLMGILKPKLALSDAQSPKISGLLTDFLKSKSGILSLAKSNPADYLSKFGGIQNKLFGGLKTALSGAQYTKFLGLKPKASDAANLLGHLFK